MFTGPVERVEGTRIFARKTAVDRQLVIYEMQVATQTEVAMVLPIPVVPNSGEQAVRFIALDHVVEFFEELDKLFDPPQLQTHAYTLGASMAMRSRTLAVHQVGAFEASYVPRLADFKRLDRRFRMPRGTLDRIPAYKDWGFAVFQLARSHELSKIHPMAFEFPTREPGALFFPTMHCHDGELHAEAVFAHVLYAQGVAPVPVGVYRTEMWRPAVDVRPPAAVAALLDPRATLTRCYAFGPRPNIDTWAPL